MSKRQTKPPRHFLSDEALSSLPAPPRETAGQWVNVFSKTDGWFQRWVTKEEKEPKR